MLAKRRRSKPGQRLPPRRLGIPRQSLRRYSHSIFRIWPAMPVGRSADFPSLKRFNGQVDILVSGSFGIDNLG